MDYVLELEPGELGLVLMPPPKEIYNSGVIVMEQVEAEESTDGR